MVPATVRKAYNYLKRNGIENTIYASYERLTTTEKYHYVEVSAEELEEQRSHKWRKKKLFSIVVPTYETKEEYLRALIDSVMAQSYEKWELILCDASKTGRVKRVTDSYEDKRIKYLKLKENGGISENTNAGISRAKGDYIGLLDHDDIITPNALYEFARMLEEADKKDLEYAFIYSDEDKCDSDGVNFFEPNYKPSFNLDLLLTNNYICHFLMVKGELFKELKLRKEYDGAQDHDLVLRAFAKTYSASSENTVEYGHIPKVLYHWRCHEASTASNPESKRYAYDAGLRAVSDYLKKSKATATILYTKHNGFYRVEYLDTINYPDNSPIKKLMEELTASRRGATAYTLFLNRYDIGAIGGPLFEKNKITGGMMDNTWTCPYDGLNKKFSGYMHRAALQQDAVAVDVRNMMLAEGLASTIVKVADDNDCKHLFKRDLIDGLREKIASDSINSPYVDVTAMLSDVKYEDYDYIVASQKLCREVALEGYLCYYDPEFIMD